MAWLLALAASGSSRLRSVPALQRPCLGASALRPTGCYSLSAAAFAHGASSGPIGVLRKVEGLGGPAESPPFRLRPLAHPVGAASVTGSGRAVRAPMAGRSASEPDREQGTLARAVCFGNSQHPPRLPACGDARPVSAASRQPGWRQVLRSLDPRRTGPATRAPRPAWFAGLGWTESPAFGKATSSPRARPRPDR